MKTLILVEDDMDYREDLKEYLEFIDYHVLVAENGEIALQLIRQHVPSIILSDVDMPIMTGASDKSRQRVTNNPFYLHHWARRYTFC